MIANFKDLLVKIFCWERRIKIFRPNGHVNVSYDMSGQSWNNSWGSATQLFLAQTIKADVQWWLAFKQHKTNQQTHANQLIPSKLRCLPVDWIIGFLSSYTHSLILTCLVNQSCSSLINEVHSLNDHIHVQYILLYTHTGPNKLASLTLSLFI